MRRVLSGFAALLVGFVLQISAASAQDADSYGELWVGGPFTGFTVSLDARPILGLAASVNMDSAGILSGSPFKAVFMDLRLSAGLGIPGLLWGGLIGGAYYLGADAPSPAEENPDPKPISDPGLEWGFFFNAGFDMGDNDWFGLTVEQVFLDANTETSCTGFMGPWGVRMTFRYGEQLVMWNLALSVNVLGIMYLD